MSRSARGLLVLAGLALLAPARATAQLPGTALYATGDEIWVKFVSYEAAYTNDLYFFAFVGQNLNDAQFLFRNKTATPGSMMQLVGTFVPGQEIIFGIHVYDQGRGRWYTYYSGDPSRNPDNSPHVQLTDLAYGNYDVRVGFEDLWQGGDKDYNDLIFDVSGVATEVVPEPITMVLFGTGLAGVGVIGRRRRKQQI